jgi:hypothetical protein
MGTDGTFPIISAEKKKTFRLSPVFPGFPFLLWEWLERSILIVLSSDVIRERFKDWN